MQGDKFKSTNELSMIVNIKYAWQYHTYKPDNTEVYFMHILKNIQEIIQFTYYKSSNTLIVGDQDVLKFKMPFEKADEFIDMFLEGMELEIPPLYKILYPRYKHDCKECIYLGSCEGTHPYVGYFDLYFCQNIGIKNIKTVIARFGNKEYEYISGLEFANLGPLLQAKLKAQKLGLL